MGLPRSSCICLRVPDHMLEKGVDLDGWGGGCTLTALSRASEAAMVRYAGPEEKWNGWQL